MYAGNVAALLFERWKATTGSRPSRLAQARSFIGLGKIYFGRAEETKAHIGEALWSTRFDGSHLDAFRGLRQKPPRGLRAGGHWLRRVIEANRNYSLAFFQLGRL